MVLGYGHGTTTRRRQRSLELSGYSEGLDATHQDGGGLRGQDRQAVSDGFSQEQVSGDGEKGDFAEGEITRLNFTPF